MKVSSVQKRCGSSYASAARPRSQNKRLMAREPGCCDGQTVHRLINKYGGSIQIHTLFLGISAIGNIF